MSGPAISWKTLATGAWRSEIVEGGKYQLASPSTVTGNPSLAMQAGQSCTVRVYIGGTLYPDASLTINGTAPVAILNAIGQPLTGQEKFDLVIEVGMPYRQNLTATDEPNGSPTSPFATTAERDAAYPPASTPDFTRCHLLNPHSPEGTTESVCVGGAWKVVSGQMLYGAWGSLLDITAAALNIAAWNEVWTSDVLPDWFFAETKSLSISSEAQQVNGNVAAAKLRLSIKPTVDLTGDENTLSILAYTSAASANSRGFSGIRARVNIRGAALFSNFASNPSQTSGLTAQSGSWSTGETRFRVQTWPAEAANTTKLNSLELWSGA